MTGHYLGRATVPVQDAWCDSVAPGVQSALDEVKRRNAAATATARDQSAEAALGAMLYLARVFWQVRWTSTFSIP